MRMSHVKILEYIKFYLVNLLTVKLIRFIVVLCSLKVEPLIMGPVEEKLLKEKKMSLSASKLVKDPLMALDPPLDNFLKFITLYELPPDLLSKIYVFKVIF